MTDLHRGRKVTARERTVDCRDRIEIGCTLALDPAMGRTEDEGKGVPRSGEEPRDGHLLAPREILDGLPDAVVGASRDGRIVFVNAVAEQLFGQSRDELVGRPVQTLWPERMRERYTRNMEQYFETDHPLRFSNEAWGLRGDGSEFVGEMTWGVVQTTAGPLLLAIGRDITARRAAEARLRAVAAMGERALAGADPAQLAADAVELMRTRLRISSAEVRLADGTVLASHGPRADSGLRLAIGAGDELLVGADRKLADDEISLVHAVA